MGATSTTDLEPLSDHGAPPRVRRIAAAHVAPPRASRHFSARQTRVNVAFLNPTSHMHNTYVQHIGGDYLGQNTVGPFAWLKERGV